MYKPLLAGMREKLYDYCVKNFIAIESELKGIRKNLTAGAPSTTNPNTSLLNSKASLDDSEGSETLPTAGSYETVESLLQSVRNNLKSLFASVVTKVNNFYSYQTPAVVTNASSQMCPLINVYCPAGSATIVLEVERFQTSSMSSERSIVTVNLLMSSSTAVVGSIVQSSNEAPDDPFLAVSLYTKWLNATNTKIGIIIPASSFNGAFWKLKVLNQEGAGIALTSTPTAWTTSISVSTTKVINAGGSFKNGVLYTNVSDVPKQVAIDEDLDGYVLKAGTAQQTMTRSTTGAGVLGIGVAGESTPRINFLSDGQIHLSTSGSAVTGTVEPNALYSIDDTVWQNCAGSVSSSETGIFASILLSGTSTSDTNMLLHITTVGSDDTNYQSSYILSVILKRQGTTLRNPLVNVVGHGHNYRVLPMYTYWNTSNSTLYLAMYKPAYASISIRSLLRGRSPGTLTVYANLEVNDLSTFSKIANASQNDHLFYVKSSTSSVTITRENFIRIATAGGVIYLPGGTHLVDGDTIELLNYSGSSQTISGAGNNIYYKTTVDAAFNMTTGTSCRLRYFSGAWYYSGNA